MENFDTLFDQLVMHQVRLMQLSISYQAEAQEEIDRTELQLSAIISSLSIYIQKRGGLRSGDTVLKSRIDTAIQEIQAVRREGYVSAFNTLKARTRQLTEYENLFMSSALKPHVSINVPSGSGLEDVEVMGHQMSKWQNRLRSNDLQRLTAATKLGINIGAPEADLLASLIGHPSYRGVDGVTASSRNELDTLVRTATNAFADAARVNINMENPLIGKEVYVAILDSRTTDTCRTLHGTLHGATDGPRPPVHWFCRSTRVPSVGNVSPNIPSYRNWLKRLSAGERVEVLGTRQARAFQEGSIKIERFREPKWRGIDIETLARRERKVFEAAGVDVPFQR